MSAPTVEWRWVAFVARLESGMTQEEFAESIGVSQGYVSMLENGRREPSPDLLVRMAAVSGVRLSALVHEAEL